MNRDITHLETPPNQGRRRCGQTARVAIAVAIGLVAAGCGSDGTSATDSGEDVTGTDFAAAASFPLTISDCGRNIDFTEAPESVLTVGVSAAALLHAAGASDAIVGRTGEFGAALPDELEAAIGDVAVIDDFDPTLEAIVAADPDVVLGYGLFNTDAADVEAAGPRTLTVTGECGHAALPDEVADVGNFAVMVEDVRIYGQLFGTEEEAEAEATDLEARINAVRNAPPITDGTSAAGAYFFGEQLSVTGQHNMLHEQMSVLGLTDVYENLDESFAEVSIESLLDADPDIIILSYGFDGDDFDAAMANLLAQPGADTLQAVINNQVIGLPAALRGPDPGAVDGLELLADELAES